MKENKKFKIILAAGGTGGHLFPAQGLAMQLMREDPGIQLLFAGAGLAENVHFDREKFSFCAVASMTPFRGNPLRSIKFLWKGIRESLNLLKEQKPDLVVGFGSFHSFPVLCAAAIKRVPFVLFASDSVPGKVIRLFSRRALFTGVFFEEAKSYLKGSSVEVDIPLRKARTKLAAEEARLKLGLKPDLPTLLVFGGSQGARQINNTVLQLLPQLKEYQLIHLTGNDEMAGEVQKHCQIPHYVRKFEPNMDLLWSAADLAICRSGAMTFAEVIFHEVPAILIPYPFASEQHQMKNAQILEQKVGGGICLPEQMLTPELLLKTIKNADIQKMKKAIGAYKQKQKKEELSRLVLGELQ